MKNGDIIQVTLRDPREQFWGELIDMNQVGVEVRGIDVRNLDEWSRECAGKLPMQLGPSQIIFPLHRIERIALDEPIGAVPSLEERFINQVGSGVKDYLRS